MKTNNAIHQLVANKYVGTNFDHQKEETSLLGNGHPHYWLLKSQCHLIRDMHRGHCVPRLDLHKFDGTDPIEWVSQMDHFFFLHNICTNIEILYLDVEHCK